MDTTNILVQVAIVLVLVGIVFLIIKSILKAIVTAVVLGVLFNIFFVGDFQGVKNFANKYLKTESATTVTSAYSDFIDKSHQNAVVNTDKVLQGVTNMIDENGNDSTQGLKDLENGINDIQDVQKQLSDINSANQNNDFK